MPHPARWPFWYLLTICHLSLWIVLPVVLWKLYLIVELPGTFSNKDVPSFAPVCILCPAWHCAWHITNNTYLFSELNPSWLRSDKDLGSVRMLGRGKVVNRGEFLYTNYFTLFAKGQPRFLLKSRPQRIEAEVMMRGDRICYKTPGATWPVFLRRGVHSTAFVPEKSPLERKQTFKTFSWKAILPLIFQNVFKWFGSIFNTRETWCCKES